MNATMNAVCPSPSRGSLRKSANSRKKSASIRTTWSGFAKSLPMCLHGSPPWRVCSMWTWRMRRKSTQTDARSAKARRVAAHPHEYPTPRLFGIRRALTNYSEGKLARKRSAGACPPRARHGEEQALALRGRGTVAEINRFITETSDEPEL